MLDLGTQLLIDDGIDAFVFNLSGVLVDADPVHVACWKQAFDEALERERRRGFGASSPEPFGSHDYERYLKGRDRYEGALAYLRHRGSTLPHGSEMDPPGNDTVCALANLKALRFRASLALRPPRLHAGARELLLQLSARRYRLGLSSSSRSAEWIVRQLGLDELLSVRMDGELASDLGIEGCPAPDRLLETARRLGVAPERTAVLDDSSPGIRAAKRGRFGWVIGVGRSASPSALRAAGADVVIDGLGELHGPADAGPTELALAGTPMATQVAPLS